MDLLKEYNTDIKRLSDVYLISNTPRFLYDRLRTDPFIQDVVSTFPIEEIVESFKKIGSDDISTIEELTTAYILYVAITLKKHEKVIEFLNNDGNIDFEWFPDIKSIYMSSYVHTNEIFVEMSNTSIGMPIKVENISNQQKNSNIHTLEINL